MKTLWRRTDLTPEEKCARIEAFREMQAQFGTDLDRAHLAAVMAGERRRATRLAAQRKRLARFRAVAISGSAGCSGSMVRTGPGRDPNSEP